MNTDKIYAESVANEYSVKEEGKTAALKRLDRKAKRPSTIFAYSFGTVFALVLGVGLCLTMGVIGEDTTAMLVLGIILGVVGIIGCGINYPIYMRLRKAGMEKYAGDVIRLANEIIGENGKEEGKEEASASDTVAASETNA